MKNEFDTPDSSVVREQLASDLQKLYNLGFSPLEIVMAIIFNRYPKDYNPSKSKSDIDQEK